ncbi:MAG: MMPL family transporter [Methylomonas sp.]|nr:MMPL family transporter [Methylomonas sp.]
MVSFAGRKRWFLLTFPLLLALTVWQTRVETDLNAFFTATGDEDSRLLSGLLQSGELSRRYLLVVETRPKAYPSVRVGLSPAGLVSRLQGRLSAIAGVEQVWPADQPPREWLEAVAFYAPYHARIFSLYPEQDALKLFDPDATTGRAEALKQILLAPQGGFVKTIAKQDPLLLSLNGFKELQGQFQSQAGSNAESATLILQSRPAAMDSAAHQALQNAIRAEFDALNAEAGDDFRLSMAGVPVVGVAANGEINRDVTLVSTVSSVLVILVFLLLFRSFAALHWIVMIQATSFLFGTLAVALSFQHVHSLTLALGASLIGICVDYPIHVMVHSAKHRTPLSAVVRLLWPSLFMGGLTTVIGYIALGMTGFPGFEQIAVFAVASIAASLGLTRWLLPAVLVHTRLHVAHVPGVAVWVGFCARRRKGLWLLFGLLVLAALLPMPNLRWVDDMQKLAMNMDLLKQQDASVRAHFASIEPGRFVLIQGSDMETALQRSEAAERRLRDLKSQGVLQAYHGLFPWLVSQSLQTSNADVYGMAMDEPFRAAWRSALGQAGLSVEKLGALPDAGNVLRPEEVLKSPVRQLLSGRLLDDPKGVALAIWLGEHDPVRLAEGLKGLDGVRYFSQKDQLNRLAGHYRDSSLRMLALGIAVMALCIWLQQRRLTRVLLTLLPSLAAVLFIFAGWALSGEEISFLHIIGLLLSVSLCVDYGIFFIENRAEDSDVTYHAIAASTMTTLASFGALALGKTPTLPILAGSVSLGVAVGFLLCPLLIAKSSKS